jgi:hypothetical protein
MEPNIGSQIQPSPVSQPSPAFSIPTGPAQCVTARKTCLLFPNPGSLPAFKVPMTWFDSIHDTYCRMCRLGDFQGREGDVASVEAGERALGKTGAGDEPEGLLQKRATKK